MKDHEPDVLILSYHAVSATWPSGLAVLPDRFETQLRLLRARGYRGVTVHQAVHEPPAERVLAVSFDDAYRSVLDVALPILERLGFVGTVFVPTDYPDRPDPMSWPGIEQWLGGRYEPELRCLSWEDLRLLSEAGWEVGSHGCSHPNLSRLSDSQLASELRESRRRLEQQLARPCHSLAYPFGAHDARVVQAVRAAGYQTACAVPAGGSKRRALTYPRVGIYRSDGMLSFRIKVSPRLRRARSGAAGEIFLPIIRMERAAVRAATGGRRPRLPDGEQLGAEAGRRG